MLEDEAGILYDPSDGSEGILVDHLITLAKGIKIIEIASQTGLSTKHVSNIMKRRKKASPSSIQKISKFLNGMALREHTNLLLR